MSTDSNRYILFVLSGFALICLISAIWIGESAIPLFFASCLMFTALYFFPMWWYQRGTTGNGSQRIVGRFFRGYALLIGLLAALGGPVLLILSLIKGNPPVVISLPVCALAFGGIGQYLHTR